MKARSGASRIFFMLVVLVAVAFIIFTATTNEPKTVFQQILNEIDFIGCLIMIILAIGFETITSAIWESRTPDQQSDQQTASRNGGDA